MIDPMKLWKDSVQAGVRLLSRILYRSGDSAIEVQEILNFPSKQLGREVRIGVFLPPAYYERSLEYYPVLLFNDGQDMEMAGMADTLERLYAEGSLRPIVVLAIHAGDRLQEYGAALRPDYKNRGIKAKAYGQFVLTELLPAMRRRYRLLQAPKDVAVAGFSLGGLSAFDLVWNHPRHFSKAGVFSGALWWRHRPYTLADPDGGRIAHEMVEAGQHQAGQRFWFQCGTHDEEDDRNGNGIIDSIDDTLDLIKVLKTKGYREGRELTYVEVIGGEHNHHTWAKVLPDFLLWAFGR